MIPAFYIVYSMSRSNADGKEPAFTRYLRSFETWQKDYAARNATHTAMLDQAAHDKILFYQSKPNSHYNLKYTEYVRNHGRIGRWNWSRARLLTLMLSDGSTPDPHTMYQQATT